MADGPVVGAQRTRGKALVSAVEKGELLPLLHDRGYLLPLILRRVHTRGVVCACVQQNDAALWCRLECTDHAIEIKALGVLAEVWVVLDWKVDVGEDLIVVCPCWRAEVYGLAFGGGGVVEPRKEEATKVVGASARDGLERGDALLLNCRRVGTEDELL